MNDNINACLAELSIGCWTARKLDKDTTKEVISAKGANSTDAAKLSKNLFAGMDNLKNITDYVAQVRNEFYRMTLPWSDNGQRLVPMAQYFDLVAWLNDKEKLFNEMVEDFIVEYPTLISAQAFQLGKLFSRADYPSVDEIRRKFNFSVAFVPVPAKGDFRIEMVDEAKAELEKQFEKTMQARLEQVNRDLWDRLHTTMRHMVDRLGYDTSGKKRIFRDTLVDNAVEMCDLLKRLNVSNDPKLDAARAALESALLGVEIKELREREGARDEVRTRVEGVLNEWL